MTPGTGSGTAATRRELEREREELTKSVQRLRGEVDRARRAPFTPSVASAAAVALAGFVLAGGVHATVRLLGARERRRRERERPAMIGWLAR